MAPPNPPPQYIYKILPHTSVVPSPLPEALPVSPLDAGDGFIHLSTSAQLLGTLKLFFANDPSVLILRLPYERVSKFMKWENGDGKENEAGEGWDFKKEKGWFPHLWGNGMKVGRDEVDKQGLWKRVTEEWSAEGWPFEEDSPAT